MRITKRKIIMLRWSSKGGVMNKKSLTGMLTAGSIIVAMLAGCGSSSTAETTASATTAAEAAETMAAGTTAAAGETTAAAGETTDAAGESSAASQEAVTEWPASSVSIVVPASAGGGTDLLARSLADKLGAKLGTNFVVVNVTGAGGANGVNQVHDAAPDGSTILFWHNALEVLNITGVLDYNYDAFDVGPGVVDDGATGFYVPADAPYDTYPELVDYCKEHPDEVTMGVEQGGYTYMMVKSFEQATGVEFNCVDVGGNSDKCTALLGGHIDIMPNQYMTAKGYIDSGNFKCLGFPTEERSEIYPDVPTAKEQGLDWTYSAYNFGFFWPAGTDQTLQTAFNNAVAEILSDESVVAELKELGDQVTYSTPEEYAAKLAANMESYQTIMSKEQ